jgi:hypothetical protein
LNRVIGRLLAVIQTSHQIWVTHNFQIGNFNFRVREILILVEILSANESFPQIRPFGRRPRATFLFFNKQISTNTKKQSKKNLSKTFKHTFSLIIYLHTNLPKNIQKTHQHFCSPAPSTLHAGSQIDSSQNSKHYANLQSIFQLSLSSNFIRTLIFSGCLPPLSMEAGNLYISHLQI